MELYVRRFFRFFLKLITMVFITLIILDNMCVKFIDCASLQISGHFDPNYVKEEVHKPHVSTEKLAIQKDVKSILSSSTTPTSLFINKSLSGLLTKVANKDRDNPSTSLATVVKDKKNVNSESEYKYFVPSSETISQCRATCIKKFIQKNLSKRNWSSSGNDENVSLYLACFNNDPKCQSCWKSCQLFRLHILPQTTPPSSHSDSDESTNKPEAVYSVALSHLSFFSTSTQPTITRIPRNNNKRSKVLDEEVDGNGESKHPILARFGNENSNISKQRCRTGCRVFGISYKKLVAQNNDHKFVNTHENTATSETKTENGKNYIKGENDTMTILSTTSEFIGVPNKILESFELRLVSLIHQNSLVLAELKWDEVGGKSKQDYLITWELNGGGLKGHLVTDSSSVTLSLWPDTIYTIHVEAVQKSSLDSNGEQPLTLGKAFHLKSLPLTVDTSVASFPLYRPSALLSNREENKEKEENENDEDDFSVEEETDEESDQVPEHKSVKIIGVVLVSLVLVLGIFTLVAITWIKLRMMPIVSNKSWEDSEINDECGENGESYSESCFSCCGIGCACVGEGNNDQLLASQEDLYSEMDQPATFYNSPMHYVLSLRNSQYCENKFKGTLNLNENSAFSENIQDHQNSDRRNLSALTQESSVALISSSFTEEIGNPYISAPISSSVFNNCLQISNEIN